MTARRWTAVAYIADWAYAGLLVAVAVLVVLVAAVLMWDAQHGQPEPDEDQAQRREVVPLATAGSDQSTFDGIFDWITHPARYQLTAVPAEQRRPRP
jgi:hypothetical protein